MAYERLYGLSHLSLCEVSSRLVGGLLPVSELLAYPRLDFRLLRLDAVKIVDSALLETRTRFLTEYI